MDSTARKGLSEIKNRSSSTSNTAINNDGRDISRMVSRGTFREPTRIPSKIAGNNKVNERLKSERLKALEILQKSTTALMKHTSGVCNKENVATGHSSKSSNLDYTDYVPHRRPNTINITDLVSDETIYLESTSSCPTSATKDLKISFEPSEITGRSTLYRRDNSTAARPSINRMMSIEEILATSRSESVRNLCDSLRESYGGDGGSSTAFNLSSLPRTADMSKASESILSLGDAGLPANGFSHCNESCFSSEDFIPAEMMQSKLLQDEQSWAQEYAAIPSAVVSGQSKKANNAVAPNTTAKVQLYSDESMIQSLNATNSILALDPNFSLGKYFDKRSEDLWNIVGTESPLKQRAPVALIDQEESATTVDFSDTPKIDNKTYNKLSTMESNQISKDSGNSTDNSYMLSMSAIERALCEIQSGDSDGAIVNRLLQAKKGKLCMNSAGRDIEMEASGEYQKTDYVTPEDILANKENLDPKSLQFSDTVSFTDSLLNSSEMKLLERSSTQPRSPLSPIEITKPIISITDYTADADIDEFPSTPIKSPTRKVCRTKSPSDGRNPNLDVLLTEEVKSNIEIKNPTKTIIDCTADADIDEFPSTPIKSLTRKVRRTKSPSDGRNPSSDILLQEGATSNNQHNLSPKMPSDTHYSVARDEDKPKSLSSTRLEDRNSNGSERCCETLGFGVSPNYSKSATPTRNNITSHVNNGMGNSPTQLTSAITGDFSPMSSPRSCFSSQVSSPSGSWTHHRKGGADDHSPYLDTTNSSDRRYLVPGAVCKSASSPIDCGKLSLPSYGLVQRASSTASLKARSSSRCSNSSEFSHRDGKAIPMKVTCLELSWGSTRLRTNVCKSMQVKNTSTKRLVLRVDVSGPGFQIVNYQGNLTLQSQECRSVSINFCPTVTGAAVGVLSFSSPNCANNQQPPSFLDIPLYGYGGHASLIPQNILKGPIGAAFLPMGDLRELSHPLEKTFRIYNKGPLNGFAVVIIDSIGLDLPRLCDCIEVKPSTIKISPEGTAKIRVTFRPRRDDIKKIVKKISNVMTLANLRIICGDEPNRQRIRNLISQMDESEKTKIASKSLDKVWNGFTNESSIGDLGILKEKPEVALDLLSSFRIHEVALTLNHDILDETVQSSSFLFADADETVLFRTICSGTSPTAQMMLDPVDEMHEEDDTSTMTTKKSNRSWSVHPSVIEFDFFKYRRSSKQSSTTFVIQNFFKSRQYFEVSCNCSGLLRFTPSEGYLEPNGGQCEVEVISDKNDQSATMPRTKQLMIMVYMENERITIPVKSPRDNSPANFR